ncbi:hypothetical protein Gpo141_00007232 [Globisporangium polare]
MADMAAAADAQQSQQQTPVTAADAVINSGAPEAMGAAPSSPSPPALAEEEKVPAATASEAQESAPQQELTQETPVDQPQSEPQQQQEVVVVVEASDTESESGDTIQQIIATTSDTIDEPRHDITTSSSGVTHPITPDSESVSIVNHHATNLLHEAVERQQKMREVRRLRLLASPPAVVNPHPEAVQSEAPDDDEDVKTKNIPDLYYLFTNDKLKEEPLTKVLNSDPFCIPRLTDNVPEYRPAFNPLSILEAEEKLLPRYFRLDPFEGIPGVNGKAGGNGSGSQREKNARDRSTMSSIPIRAKKAAVTGGKVATAFKGKTSTFMGTLPRQTEFSEIPVPDTLFKTQQTFRPTPPPPPAPHPSYASKSISSMRLAKEWETTSAAAAPTSSSSQPGSASSGLALDPETSGVALTDAMFLTSLHQSGGIPQPQPQQHNAYSHADHQFQHHDFYASKEASHQQQQYTQAQYEHMYQQQQQHDEYEASEHSYDQQTRAEKLTRYLPPTSTSRPPHHSSSGMSDRSHSPTPYMDDASYLVGHHHSHQQQGHYSHPYHSHQHSNSGAQYLGSMFDDGYRDSNASSSQQLAEDMGNMGTSSSYGDNSSSSQLGDNQSLQPIPKKPRSKNVFRPCTAPGCTKGARGKSGLCQKHGGGKRCAEPNCSKGAQGSSAMCLFHGGGYRCTVDGCSTGARGTSGLCAKHGGYKRGKEPGGGVSPTSSSGTGGGGGGKRARTQHSPMDFGDHLGDGQGSDDAPRFDNLLC